MAKENEQEDKVQVNFRCSQEMADFIKEKAGEESIATTIRLWIREKMETEKQSTEHA